MPAGAPFYTPDTRLGIGLYTILCVDSADTNLGKTNEVVLFFTGTSNLQASMGIQPEWYLSDGLYRLGGYFEIASYPGVYWGIGSDTETEDSESYEPVYIVGKISIYRRVSPSLYLGPRLSYRYSEIESGTSLSRLEGGEGSTILGLGAGGVWDSRNSSFYPTAGLLVEGFVEQYSRTWGSGETFGIFQLDIRGYFPVGKEGVFALQGRIQSSWGDVPFLSYPSLGGSMTMRGYPIGRFQDRTGASVQGEYRFPLMGRLGGVVFMGMGDVQPSWFSYNLSTLKLVGGMGLRFLLDTERRINARLDLGFTSEGIGVYVLVKEAF
ncbi:MAG: BamA/TamA family outer membrane protein [Spirochaetales bacterium]